MGIFRREARAGTGLERRDPSAATKNLRWVTPDRAEPADWDATSAFEIAYYMSVVIYACVRLHANTLSSLPFRTGADPTKPHDYDPNSRLAKLLGPPPGGPAPRLAARRLWAWTVAQRVVTGRNAWEVEWAGDQIAALWPLASSSLKAIPSTGGTDWFKGFTYGRPGDERNLTNRQVVYDWDPSGTDFRQPESPLQAANLDIAVSVMQSKYDFSFLKNDARPSAIVVTEAFEDEDSFSAFKQQWNSNYGGPDNAGRMAFLESTGGDNGVTGAVDVKVLGFSPKDAQAAQRHTAAMERCAMALGTPWSLLDASGRTFSNAGQEWTNWCHNRLIPSCRDFADMVNMQIAPQLGNQVGWFDLTQLGVESQVDPVTAQVGAPAMVQAQLMTKNEARADYGLPPVKDGDRFMTAEEIQSLTSTASPVRALENIEQRDTSLAARELAPPALAPAPVPEFAQGSRDQSLVTVAATSAPADIDHEARRGKLWTSTDGKVRNLERQWERALRKMFARQQRSALARLEGKRGRASVREARAPADEVFDPNYWIAETTDDVIALYEAVTAAGGARVSDLFGLAFDLEAAYAQDFVKARANQLAGEITATTYEAVKDALAAGIAEGEGIPELATRLRGVFEQASQTRAVTIARTEVISAFNGAATLTATELGGDVVAGQEWIATRDARTREWHAERDGEIVPIGDTFSGGLAYPGDPAGGPEETVNCRCTVAFLTPDEMDARSGGRSRWVEQRVAHAFLRLVQPGPFDERAWREALKVAA